MKTPKSLNSLSVDEISVSIEGTTATADSKPISVALVDDNPAFSDTLQTVLNLHPGFRWAGTWNRPLKFLSELPSLKTDVILLDVNMPKIRGTECVSDIKQLHPETSIIMLTVVDDDKAIFQAIQDGADGYVLKDSSVHQLTEAIREAKMGGLPMTASIARRVVNAFRSSRSQEVSHVASPNRETLAALTHREREVIGLLAEGQTYGEIAASLGVGTETIKKHTRQIYSKLKVRNRTEATARYFAVER